MKRADARSAKRCAVCFTAVGAVQRTLCLNPELCCFLTTGCTQIHNQIQHPAVEQAPSGTRPDCYDGHAVTSGVLWAASFWRSQKQGCTVPVSPTRGSGTCGSRHTPSVGRANSYRPASQPAAVDLPARRPVRNSRMRQGKMQRAAAAAHVSQ